MTTNTLMPIPDINDVFTDGFLIDESGSVAFLSLIGKDTAIQEFRARWSLPVTQGGLTDFQVETIDGTARLNIGNPETLEFLSGRLSTKLFGDLIQVFVYQNLAQKPDFANRKSLQLFKKDTAEDHSDKLWTLIKSLSPLPFLDEWREVIIGLFTTKHWLRELPGVGVISAYAITIPEDELAEMLKANIQSGALMAEASVTGSFIDHAKTTLLPPKCLTDLSEELESTVADLEEGIKRGDSPLHEIFGKPVSTYTRSQAIDDGFLVDVSETSEAKESGFIVPVALTCDVWDSYVAWPSDVGGQDEKGRLWDVLFMAHHAIKTNKENGEHLLYKLYCVPHNSKKGDDATEVSLKLVSGPGDNGEHVITIMKPNES
ncbi:MAG: hypothetical protein L3J75_15980 [Methylococcaceae bacterium]|nr:hypothetical protein [Methylococcaceae bacterium]